MTSTPVTASDPTAPPTAPRSDDETAFLLAFVRERNVHCPRCDYNLRNLTQPVCPECREELHLTIGSRRPQLGFLIAALAPGIFSGIAAFFVGGMLVFMAVSPRGRADWRMYALDAFGWASAIVALGLFFKRYKFLKQSASTQTSVAAAIWLVHIGFFLFMWIQMR